jgi:HEPN domain-containing protein
MGECLFLIIPMNKLQHIEYWKDTAAKDWTAVQHMFKSKDYVHALFFAHLVLEKLLKAHWVKDNKGNHPPRIHNLVSLAGRIQLSFTDDDMIFLGKMNDFQLEGRYPDVVRNIYKLYKFKQTQPVLKEVDKIRKCLLKNLQ